MLRFRNPQPPNHSMLVLSHLKGAFTPVCKAASSSLILTLAEDCYNEEYIESEKQLHGHYYNGLMRKKMHTEFAKSPCNPEVREEIKNYFKFAFVKNPWHRMVSACLQLRRWIDNKIVKDDFKGLHLLKLYDLMNKDYSFENFVHFVKNVERNHTEYVNQHWRSQVGILQMDAFPSCKTTYDFIGKLETADEDWDYIVKKLNLRTKKLKQMNSTKNLKTAVHVKDNLQKTREIQMNGILKTAVEEDYDYRDFYTNSKLIDDVGEYFTRDIELLKYEYGK